MIIILFFKVNLHKRQNPPESQPAFRGIVNASDYS